MDQLFSFHTRKVKNSLPFLPLLFFINFLPSKSFQPNGRFCFSILLVEGVQEGLVGHIHYYLLGRCTIILYKLQMEHQVDRKWPMNIVGKGMASCPWDSWLIMEEQEEVEWIQWIQLSTLRIIFLFSFFRRTTAKQCISFNALIETLGLWSIIISQSSK